MEMHRSARKGLKVKSRRWPDDKEAIATFSSHRPGAQALHGAKAGIARRSSLALCRMRMRTGGIKSHGIDA